MKCIKKAITFDGVNLLFNGNVIQRAPKDLIESGSGVPKARMDTVKEGIIEQVCGV